MRPDPEAKATYRAEQAVGLWEEPELSIEEAQAFADTVLADPWLTDVIGFPSPASVRVGPVEYDPSTGLVAWYLQASQVIGLTVYGRQPATVLHELAHHLADPRSQHGAQFRMAFVLLVGRHLGTRLARELVDAYHEEGLSNGVAPLV